MLDPQAFFESLADPIRRRILAMLLESDERCVCDIHGALDVPQPKVSRHLAVLRGADLVLARRDGVWGLGPLLSRFITLHNTHYAYYR